MLAFLLVLQLKFLIEEDDVGDVVVIKCDLATKYVRVVCDCLILSKFSLFFCWFLFFCNLFGNRYYCQGFIFQLGERMEIQKLKCYYCYGFYF